MIRENWRRLGIALALASAGSGEAAAAVVYADTVLARGPEYASTTELGLDGPGSYQITTTDLHWLNSPLGALSFGVFTATAPIKTMTGAGTLEFFYAGQGKVFLQLYVRPAAGKSAALVGVAVNSVAVVALPASLWLLLSALSAAGFWGWLQRRAGAALLSPDPAAVPAM
jgi:hypothetical protein